MTLEELQARAGHELLFHYTDAIRAAAIMEERCFVSGPRDARGFGIYVTDIAPSDPETIDDVIVNWSYTRMLWIGGVRKAAYLPG
ncbi:MAG: hypothetical protein ACYCU0_05980 [Solirubrobacteraceae bacterium]